MNPRSPAMLFSGMIALAACSATAPKPTPALVITDITNALTVIQADIALVPNLPPATVSTVQADAAKGLEVLAALSAEADKVTTAKALQQAEGFLNAALMALPAVLPPPYSLYVQAAAAIIPTIEAYITSIQTGPVVAGSHMSAASKAGGMSPQTGSVILAKAAH